MLCTNCNDVNYDRPDKDVCGNCEKVACGEIFPEVRGYFVLELDLGHSPKPWSRRLSEAEILHFTDDHLRALGPCESGRLGLRIGWDNPIPDASPVYVPVRQLSAYGLRLAAAQLATTKAVRTTNPYGFVYLPRTDFTRRPISQRPSFDADVICRWESDTIDVIDAALGIGIRHIAVIVFEFSHYIAMHKERAASTSAVKVASKMTEEFIVAVAESKQRFDPGESSSTPRDEKALQENRRLLESNQRRLAELKDALTAANLRMREANREWKKKRDLAQKAHREEDLRVLKRRLDRLAIPSRTEDGRDYDSYSDVEEAVPLAASAPTDNAR